jgi:hypothetical protein
MSAAETLFASGFAPLAEESAVKQASYKKGRQKWADRLERIISPRFPYVAPLDAASDELLFWYDGPDQMRLPFSFYNS